jgi:hypothetical protein
MAAGRLPDPPYYDEDLEQRATFRLALQQLDNAPRSSSGCEPIMEPVQIRLEQGQRLRFTGEILVNESSRRLDRNALRFRGGMRGVLEAVGRPLELTIRPDPRSNEAAICGVQPGR